MTRVIAIMHNDDVKPVSQKKSAFSTAAFSAGVKNDGISHRRMFGSQYGARRP
jgi:hypothetical protein